MKHFLSYHIDGRCMLDEMALWEKSQASEVVWCFKQCSSGKPWVHVNVTLRNTYCSTSLNIAADQVHPFMETIFPDDSRHYKHCPGTVWGTWQRVHSVVSVSKFSRSPFNQASVGFAEAAPHKLQDLKDLLLMSRCQIHQIQHTFRKIVKSMSQPVRAVVVEQYWLDWWGTGCCVMTGMPTRRAFLMTSQM